MKWTNPGHQLDELGAKYVQVRNLYIYGNDEKSKKAYECLCWLGIADEFKISFVQDITVFNRETDHTFCGKRIIPFQTVLCDELKENPASAAVVLPWIAQTNERAILEKIGVSNIFYLLVSHNRRDNFIQNFLCVWLMYKHHRLLSHSTNFVTTLRCNLRCKCCLNFNNYIKDPQNVPFETFKKHIDLVFQKFDYLYSLHLCGGEPLVVKDLSRFIRYIEENYKDRVFEFFIITNGTIIPSEEVIAATKALNGRFLVDDYSATVATTKVKEIQELLANHNVDCQINKVDRWFDLAIESTDYSALTDAEMEQHKDSCNSYLQEFADGKIFACCYSIYANRAGVSASAPTGEMEDYIDISKSSKMEILEYRQGYTRKGYVDMCRHCKGIGQDASFVPAAVQEPKIRTAHPAHEETVGEKARVTICIPIYNTVKYLERCVNSVLSQTYSNLEVILTDDGSTDGSGQLCDEFARNDERVRVIHKDNGGEASARNAALKAATGDYVMFIDSDDEYLPNAVQMMVETMEANDADLVIGGYIERNGTVEHFSTGHQRCYSAQEMAYTYLTDKCQYSMPYIGSTVNAKLFRRDLLIGWDAVFDERFVIGNDSVFMCNYLAHVRYVYDVLCPVYIYYKYQPEERVQGMRWYYPDGFFLFAYVADRMIKLAHPEEAEYRQLIAREYKNFLYALMNAAVNEDLFKNGILPYFMTILREIDFVETAARLDVSEHLIPEELGALPIQLLSSLIVEQNYDELWNLLKHLGKIRGLVAYGGQDARQMIAINDDGCIAHQKYKQLRKTAQLEEEKEELQNLLVEKKQHIHEQERSLLAYKEQLQEQADTLSKYKEQMQVQERSLLAYKEQLQEQADTLSKYKEQMQVQEHSLSACKNQIYQLESRIKEADNKASELQKQIESLLNSKSWKITKPLRKIRSLKGRHSP